MRRARLIVTTCVLGIVLACSGSSVEGELLVSAAASLTDAFAEMESVFEEANTDVDVVLNLGSSSALREQILEGAPADVFASANTSNMDQVADAGELSGGAEIFVTNSLQMRTLPIGLMFLKESEGVDQWGPIMAGTVLVVLPMLLLFLFAQRYIIAGLAGAAVKN